MRQQDPEQDTGRQARQRFVIEEVLRKIATPETLMNYQVILNSLSANVQTSFQLSDFLAQQTNSIRPLLEVHFFRTAAGRLQSGFTIGPDSSKI